MSLADPLAEQRFKPMISRSFPWGEGRRNAFREGGLAPAVGLDFIPKRSPSF